MNHWGEDTRIVVETSHFVDFLTSLESEQKLATVVSNVLRVNHGKSPVKAEVLLDSMRTKTSQLSLRARGFKVLSSLAPV